MDRSRAEFLVSRTTEVLAAARTALGDEAGIKSAIRQKSRHAGAGLSGHLFEASRHNNPPPPIHIERSDWESVRHEIHVQLAWEGGLGG